MSQLAYKLGKYLSVFRINLSNHLAYVADFIIRTLFLLLILFIFTQLWETTYAVTGETLIEGYSLKMLIWYLVITESIIMAMPRLVDKVEQEVKNGDIAYYLNRPLSYIGYHCCGYLSESMLRVTINLLIGSMLIYLLYDGIPMSWSTVGLALLLIVNAFILHFLMTMGVSLAAFWIEEVRGYELVFTRIMMILGGLMVPLEIFPAWLEKIARLLPFQQMIYVPATHVVGTATHSFWSVMAGQWLWILIFFIITSFIFNKGVKKLNVNGG